MFAKCSSKVNRLKERLSFAINNNKLFLNVKQCLCGTYRILSYLHNVDIIVNIYVFCQKKLPITFKKSECVKIKNFRYKRVRHSNSIVSL